MIINWVNLLKLKYLSVLFYIILFLKTFFCFDIRLDAVNDKNMIEELITKIKFLDLKENGAVKNIKLKSQVIL